MSKRNPYDVIDDYRVQPKCPRCLEYHLRRITKQTWKCERYNKTYTSDYLIENGYYKFE